MSYSSRSSLFLKIKAISQHKSTSILKRLSGLTLLVVAIIIFISPPINKILNYSDFWLDAKLNKLYLAGEKLNAKISTFTNNVVAIFNAPNVIQNLEEENQKLQMQITQLAYLNIENEQLKNALKFITPSVNLVATAPLILKPSVEIGMAKILAGNLKAGQFIITSSGNLIGKIISAGSASAKALLITDPTSRIAVLFPRINTRAILGGNYSGELDIIFSETDIIDSLQDGDIALTSGGDGIIPGIIVGKVHKAEESGKAKISLIEHPTHANIVSIFEVIQQ